MELELLREIGLTDSEIKVYLALLELGSSSKGPIVDKSGVASSKVYELLEKLMQKGLASFVIKAGVKHYEAAPPTRIMDYMKDKEKRIDSQKRELEKLIPELELKRAMADTSETQVFKGMKGAKTAFDDIFNLKKGEEVVISGFSDVSENFQNFLLRFHRKRAEKGIRCRLINGTQLSEFQEKMAKYPLTEVKTMPMEERPVATLVYGDKTLFSMPYDDLWIQIKNKRLADSFRDHFEKLWNQDINVYSGFENVTKRFDSSLSDMKKDDEYYVLGASLELGDDKMNRWLDNFHSQRVKEHKRVKFLSNNKAEGRIRDCVINAGDKDFNITQMRKLPNDFDAPFQINLMEGEKVWITLWQDEIKLFEINSKAVYENFKTYFDALWKQDTYVVKGIDSIEQLFDEMLEAGQCDFIAARGYFVDESPKFIDGWEKRAAASGFKMRNIVDAGVKGHRITEFPFAKTRYTLKKEFAELSVFWIFGDKVVISNWTGDEPTAVIINNKATYDMYKKQFELLWKD